jgi:hypothetical protein
VAGTSDRPGATSGILHVDQHDHGHDADSGFPMSRRTQLVASLVLPTLHFLWCLAIALGVVTSEGSWAWFFVFVADFPVSLIPLLLGSVLDIGPFLLFSLIGTAWWYFINRVLVYVALNAFTKGRA